MDAESADRTMFESEIVTGGRGADALGAVERLRAGDPTAPKAVASLTMHVAAVAPERLTELYDALTEGWLGSAPDAPPVSAPAAGGTVPGAFYQGLWALVDDPDVGRDPADITVRTAALAGLLSDSFRDRTAAIAAEYPGVAEAAAGGLPDRFRLEDLARCPRDSLGGHLHSLVVDKGFDLEVLDRDSLGLAELPPPLDYLNVRILQCHDVWHEVAGYETTGLHEVGISGFQMGQFGHHYSSTFLALVLTLAAWTLPFEATGFTLDIILSGYRHGRETPPLLGVEWEAIWDRPLDDVRRLLGVSPFESPYPAGLLEELRSA